ncbi:hypothetical protein AeMF1_009313 [Aphanomyces euteiches]|nr:hypothetical protein AeMF1_009313 [Aphanomyces euteiches]
MTDSTISGTNTWLLGELSQVEYRVFSTASMTESRSLQSRVQNLMSSSLARSIPLATSCLNGSVYLFLINTDAGMDDCFPSLSIEFDHASVAHGKWIRNGDALESKLLGMLQMAIEAQVEEWLLQHSQTQLNGTRRSKSIGAASGHEFRRENGYLIVNEPHFEFRSLSSNRSDNWQTFEDNQVPKTMFYPRVSLSNSSELLVYFIAHTLFQENTVEIGKSSSASLLRLHGLSSLIDDKVDTWAVLDTEVNQSNVFPRLVEMKKSKLKRHREDISSVPDMKEVDDMKDKDDGEDDEKDDEEEGQETPEVKRVIQGQSGLDEESIVPIAPDLASVDLEVCVEFPSESGCTAQKLSSSKKIQQYIRKEKVRKKMKLNQTKDPLSVLSRVKVVDDDFKDENAFFPLPGATTLRPLSLNLQALEWLSHKVSSEMLGSAWNAAIINQKKLSSVSIHEKVSGTPLSIRHLDVSSNLKSTNSHALLNVTNDEESTQIHDQPAHDESNEIIKGLHILSRDALVSWSNVDGKVESSLVKSPLSNFARQNLSLRLAPHLQSLSRFYKQASSNSEWLNVKDYFVQWADEPPPETQKQVSRSCLRILTNSLLHHRRSTTHQNSSHQQHLLQLNFHHLYYLSGH